MQVTKEIIDRIVGTQMCPMCSEFKYREHILCFKCFDSLPPNLAKYLARRFTPTTVSNALTALGCTHLFLEPLPPPGEEPRLIPPPSSFDEVDGEPE
jgi:hypothetical protein